MSINRRKVTTINDLNNVCIKENGKWICSSVDINMSYKDFFDALPGIIRINYDYNNISITEAVQIEIINCCFFNTDTASSEFVPLPPYICFKKCKFTTPIQWIELYRQGSINNTEQFKEEQNNLIFQECIFEQNIIIEKVVRKISINFKECEFNKDIKIQCLAKESQIILENTKNYSINNFQIANCDKLFIGIEENVAKIDKITIKNINDLLIRYGSSSINILELDNVSIDDGLRISNNSSLNNLLVKNCIFKHEVNLNDGSFNCISFGDSTFEKKVLFMSASVKEFSFINCNFYDTVKIVDLKNDIIEKVSFERSTIKGMLLFNGMTNGELILKKNTTINFTLVFVESTGYIIIRNIKNGFFDFNYGNILGNLVLQSNEIQKLNLEYTSIVGQLIYENIDQKAYNFSNSRTLTKIKNEYLKKNDQINALKYKAMELAVYRTEIKKKSLDRFLLWLNTVSNSNGQNWFRGIIFTLFVCILASFFYQISLENFYFNSDIKNCLFFDNEFWKQVLEFLWLPYGFKEIADKSSVLSSFIFLVGKIFIAYGIYQTIVAFRKYGK